MFSHKAYATLEKNNRDLETKLSKVIQDKSQEIRDIEHAKAKDGREAGKAILEVREGLEKSKHKYQVEIEAAWQKTTQSVQAERVITSWRISSIHKSAITHQKR